MAKWSVLDGGDERGRKARQGRGGAEQLDLFAGLGGGMKLSDAPRREPEHVRMVLPPDPAGDRGRRIPEPPDVASDVRGIFSGSDESAPDGDGLFPDEARGADDGAAEGPVVLGRAGAPTEGKPLPPTGVFRRPQAPVEPPEDEAEDGGEGTPALPWGMRLRARLAGLEWNGRLAVGVGVAMVCAMALGIWSARGCGGGGTEPTVAENPAPEAEAIPPPAATEDAAAAVAEAVPAAEPSAAAEPKAAQEVAASAETPAPPPPPPLPAWTLAGAKVATDGGAWTVTFEVPLFESGAYISKAGMPVLKALGAKLKGLEGGTVLVTGHTDNVPLSRPTAEFRSNADVAAARAEVAAEHLRAFAKNGKLEFRTAAGAETDAPWPNDTPEHRRLNRTAVVRVEPAAGR